MFDCRADSVEGELFAQLQQAGLFRVFIGFETESDRELDVLRLMARGHTNGAIAADLYVSESAVSKHVGAIFTKLGLPAAPSDHRRVLAVLTYLRA